MSVAHDLSITNLIISAAILLFMLTGKCYLLWRIVLLRRDVLTMEDQLKQLPSIIVGELILSEAFREWGARQNEVEKKVELMERLIDVLTGNGEAPHE